MKQFQLRTYASWFAFIAVILLGIRPDRVHADMITDGKLTFNLDGDAFANGADTALLASYGVTYNSAQTFMEFAKHGQNALPGRPAPSSGPGAVTDFRDLRATWVRPSSTGLEFGFNSNLALQTFQYDPATVSVTGGTGNIRFTGGNSFWYGNDPIIDTGSVWLMYGNMDLAFDAARIGGGNSGWFFRNNVLAPLPIFDVRNPMIDTSNGGLAISGELYTSAEFRDNPMMPFFIQSGLNVGTFSFSGVPEPSALFVLSAVGGGFLLQRRSRKKIG